MFERWSLIGLSAAGLLFGCSSAAGRLERVERAPVVSEATAPSVTAADLSVDGWDATLLQALRRYRPLFLRSRGVVPMVTIDGAPAMDLSILETMTVSSICDVRLLRASLSHEYVGEVLYVRLRTSRRDCSHA